jgi:hypothetical protein
MRKPQLLAVRMLMNQVYRANIGMNLCRAVDQLHQCRIYDKTTAILVVYFVTTFCDAALDTDCFNV